MEGDHWHTDGVTFKRAFGIEATATSADSTPAEETTSADSNPKETTSADSTPVEGTSEDVVNNVALPGDTDDGMSSFVGFAFCLSLVNEVIIVCYSLFVRLPYSLSASAIGSCCDVLAL